MQVCLKQGNKFEGFVLNRVCILRIFLIVNKDRVSNLQWLPYTKILVKWKESKEVLYGNKFASINSHWSRVENA